MLPDMALLMGMSIILRCSVEVAIMELNSLT